MLVSGSTRPNYLQCPFEQFIDVCSTLLCYLALHHPFLVRLRMFTEKIPCSSIDLVCSGRRRRRPVVTALRPPAAELARRVEALAVPVDKEV